MSHSETHIEPLVMRVSNGNWIESTVHYLQATKPLFGEQCLKVHVREMVLVAHLNEL